MKGHSTKEQVFLKSAFREYYFNNIDELYIPPRIEQHEFGFMLFDGEVMVRHMSFDSASKFKVAVLRTIPKSIYYSPAYYENPSYSMENKGWKGADLVFDIDTDSVEQAVAHSVRISVCKDCGSVYAHETSFCERCGSGRVVEELIPTKAGIDACKDEVVKLVEVLEDDFGASRKNITVYFSGNRGFHVHAEEETMRPLDQSARYQLVNYITLKGFSLKFFGIPESLEVDSILAALPSPYEFGWRKRMALRLMKEWGIDVADYKKYQAAVSAELRKSGAKWLEETMRRLIGELGVKLDPVVAVDIYRIFRLPGSLHHKTGLVKKECKKLEEFDPFLDAVGIRSDEGVKVEVKYLPEMEFEGRRYGPYTSTTVKLPKSFAVYLVAFGLASLE